MHCNRIREIFSDDLKGNCEYNPSLNSHHTSVSLPPLPRRRPPLSTPDFSPIPTSPLSLWLPLRTPQRTVIQNLLKSGMGYSLVRSLVRSRARGTVEYFSPIFKVSRITVQRTISLVADRCSLHGEFFVAQLHSVQSRDRLIRDVGVHVFRESVAYLKNS